MRDLSPDCLSGQYGGKMPRKYSRLRYSCSRLLCFCHNVWPFKMPPDGIGKEAGRSFGSVNMKMICFSAAAIAALSAVVAMAQPGGASGSLQSIEAPNLSMPVPARAAKPQGAQTFGSAPALSRLAVAAVYSTKYGGWENMSSIGQAATVGQHGGAQLRVLVQEIGYGNNPVGSYAGGTLPTAKNYQTDPICVVNNQYTSPCPAGYTVVGFYRYYNLDGFTAPGTFSFQDTSSNAPWNTLYTKIYIN
ncbi:DUF4879 domain-containing protein [Chromobacterium sp. IIBBL 290-4]|uniref:DUF4879 domain-containing protein n=1 Tax=Chromobacterium sp. IIBBL 290-4 TaxID=2953890 RepID=UPI0020B71DD7|nr:DUF4879 domain-containing protein [Chromobacterium sp. IIBBL 290-4]UTH74469.1 YolA family protein [Chromobacterium sp. IIBBL 290-4]